MVKRNRDLKVVFNEHMKGGDGTVKIVHYAEKEEIGGNQQLATAKTAILLNNVQY